jgi:hypothetical protein
MSAVREWVVDLLGTLYRPAPTLTPWEFAEQHVVLSPRESIDHAGPFDSSLAPQNRWLMERAVDPEVRELFVTKSSQSGVTLSMLLVILWMIANRPANVIYCIDSQSEVMRISRGRLRPMIESCEPTRCQVSEDEDQTNLTMYMRGMILYMIGAHSAGSLANKTAGLVILDELDKHPTEIEGEGSTADLARDRLKNVSGGKLIGFSTPTTRTGQTWREYERGSQHQCFVPCPVCGHMQPLVWERVRFAHCKDLADGWDYERVVTETYYECEMGCKIEERHKREMLQRYEWRSTNPRAPKGKLSCVQSDLYSLFGNVSWGRLACKWLDAQGNQAAIDTFFRTHLGLAPKETANELSEDQVLACRAAYKRGTMPIEPVLVGILADTQGDHQKWVKIAYDKIGSMYVIDWGATLAMEELPEVADDPIPDAAGGEWIAQAGLIDEGGDKTMAVRRWVLNNTPRWFSCKGRGGLQVRHTLAGSEALVDGQTLLVYHYDDDGYKRQLYYSMIRRRDHQRKYGYPQLFLPVDATPEFIAELRSERLVLVKGRMEWQTNKKVGPNDFGDCVKEGLVLWTILGPAAVAAQLTAPG